MKARRFQHVLFNIRQRYNQSDTHVLNLPLRLHAIIHLAFSFPERDYFFVCLFPRALFFYTSPRV